MKLAFLGPHGTLTEEAALKYGPQAELEAFASISAVGLAVDRGMVDEGVVPIENSLEGSVTETLDLLIREGGLHMYTELVLPVRHCLLVKSETKLSDIKVVYSHPQALAQCRNFLERCLPKAELVASLSTSAAVIDMKGSQMPGAAVAPKRAATIHGVTVIGDSIEDNPNNVTRFVVLDSHDHSKTSRDKTSLCFSFDEDKPGLLYNALGEFARRSINLAKVESRPTKESLGRYIFLIDCEGHREDIPVREAIDALRSQTSMLKIFGSYPRWAGS